MISHEYVNKEHEQCCLIPVVTWCIMYIYNIFHFIDHYNSTVQNNTYMYMTYGFSASLFLSRVG